MGPRLSIVIPVWMRRHNLRRLVPSIRAELRDVVPDAEIVVALPPDGPAVRPAGGIRIIRAAGSGYGRLLRAGLEAARGRYVATMDADFSHLPTYLRTMWASRGEGEVLVGSRYTPGSRADMPPTRKTLSLLLNRMSRKLLALPYRDLSSGFRMYRRDVLESVSPLKGQGLDVLPEILVKAHCQGWRILEVPFWYRGTSPPTPAWLGRLSIAYATTLGRMFSLRNSVKAADYDHRAFDSWIPLQRWWQRKRHELVVGFAGGAGRVLDIGCGSGRVVQSIPGCVGMDIAASKLRWLRAPGRALVRADIQRVPFRDEAFDAVICAEVIEHVPRERVSLEELVRVIRPGGLLILGTPDYGRRLWTMIEWLYGTLFPGGYADEHINRYSRSELEGLIRRNLGLDVMDLRYVAGSDMIFKARRPRLGSLTRAK